MRVLGSALGGLVAGALLAGCGPAGDAAAPAPPVASSEDAAVRAPAEVPVASVTETPLEASLAASGTVQARRVTALGSEVPGRVVAIRVDVGDAVETGETLFHVDPAPFELALAEAEAALALARAEQRNAEQEAERVRQLLAQRAASQRHYDQLRTAADVARARVAQMEARVAGARRNLECSVVRAPYAGTLIERRVHEGAMVGTEPVLVLQETGALEAVLAIPEAWPAPVRVGDRVRLRAPGLPHAVETRVARVNARVDPATRTYEVRAPVPAGEPGPKAGSYVEAEVWVGTGEPVPSVDRSAVVLRDGHTYVLRVEDGVARRREVRIGLGTGSVVEVREGLAPGDRVIVGEAARRIEDGARVEPASRLSSAGDRER